MRKILLNVIACFVFVVLSNGLIQAQQSSTADQKTTTSSPSKTSDAVISFKGNDKSMDVLIDGELFTTFDYGNYAKPILYPILGPGQIGMTRNWPMKDGVEGEAHDHPHHKSMWISTEISGVDFWGEKGGSVKTLSVEQDAKMFAEKDAIRAVSFWVRKSDGKTLLNDWTVYRFGVGEASRWIDCTITYKATHGDFQFDDTKEGLFAIRTHPDLRLTPKPRDGVMEVFGSAINSEGETGKGIWGKAAKWVLYQGPIDGTPMSIAMYDDPTNLRHPTTWHARDYGLVTANPFGLHHFQDKEKGAGAFVVKDGDALTLRYRVEFIKGLATVADIEKRYEAFCKAGKKASKASQSPAKN
jgi:hypothetical protein